LITKDKTLKLVDFGFTAEYGLDLSGRHIKRTTKCGTYDYFAPEVLFSDNQTDKVDIWCVGILLYEILHKKAPYSD
jgi:serine/threonine protein kinase